MKQFKSAQFNTMLYKKIERDLLPRIFEKTPKFHPLGMQNPENHPLAVLVLM
jgi:hypothetical protein